MFKLYFAFQVGMQYPQQGWKFALLVLPISASWLWVGLSLALFRRAAFTAVLLLLAVQFIVNPLIFVAEVAAVKEPFEQANYLDAALKSFKSTGFFEVAFYVLLFVHSLQFHRPHAKSPNPA